MSVRDDLSRVVTQRLRIPAEWRERLKPPAPDGLSSRLLLLTVVFTLAVEALIVGPSAASFHERWLMDRLQAAELASVGVEALPYNAVDDATAESMLRIGGVSAVAISDQGVMRQLLQAPNLPRAPDFIDLRGRNLGARLGDPVRTLFGQFWAPMAGVFVLAVVLPVVLKALQARFAPRPTP